MKDFWEDKKIRKNLTPEERYFYMYLLTNPEANLCGCYQISMNKISHETGLSNATIEMYLNRFITMQKIAISRTDDTLEILIYDYYKYFWKCEEYVNAAYNEIEKDVKDESFKAFLIELINNYKVGEIVSSFCEKPVDNSEKEKKDNEVKEFAKQVVLYMNEKCKTKYKPNSAYIIKHIIARVNDGFADLEDYKEVIDKKSGQWLGTDYEKYLRPDTLFGRKFEIYLSEKDKNYERKVKEKQREEQKKKDEENEEDMNFWDNDTNAETEQ